MTIPVSGTSASAGDVARAGSTHESKIEKIRLSKHSALRYDGREALPPESLRASEGEFVYFPLSLAQTSTYAE